MWDWVLFSEIIIFLMSITFILLGVLTAYFGSGKSRAAGIGLLLAGIIIPTLLYFLKWASEPGYFMDKIIWPGLLYIGGGLIGVIIGFVVFLGIIMKT